MPRDNHSHSDSGNSEVFLLDYIILLLLHAFMLIPLIVDLILYLREASKQNAAPENDVPSSYGQAMEYLPVEPAARAQPQPILLPSEQVDLIDTDKPPLTPVTIPKHAIIPDSPFAKLEQEIETLKQQISALVFQTKCAFQVFRASWRAILEQPLSILDKTWEIHVQNNIYSFPEEADNLRDLEGLFNQLKGKYKGNPGFLQKLRSSEIQEERRVTENWKQELAAAAERDKRSGGILSILAETREGSGLQNRH